MKQVRWKCPTCGNGLLAPSRPRRNDVRRYCLPCSSKAGVLVERVAPALDKQRETREKARAERERKKREKARRQHDRAMNTPRELAKRKFSVEGEYGMPIKRETARLWKLLAKMPTTMHGAERTIRRVTNNHPPHVTLFKKGWRIDEQQRVWITGARLGVAWQGGTIEVAPCVSWETLAHEIIHVAGYRGHDSEFYNALKWLAEARFKTRIDFSTVTRYGYWVDGLIATQIDDIVRAEFEKTPQPQTE